VILFPGTSRTDRHQLVPELTVKTIEKLFYVVLVVLAVGILANTFRNCRRPRVDEKPPLSESETVAPDGTKYPLTPEVQERVEPTNK
jgi:hypothetical protein